MLLPSIPPFITGVFAFLIGFLALGKHVKSSSHVSFFLLMVCLAGWQLSWAVLFPLSEPVLINSVIKVGYTFIVLIPSAFYWFVLCFLDLHKSREWIVVLGTLVINVMFVFFLYTSTLFIEGYYTFSWGVYPKASLVLHPLHLLLVGGVIVRLFYLLYTFLSKSVWMKSYELKYILLSLLVLSLAGVDYLINYGVAIYPFGLIFMPVMVCSLYAVIIRGAIDNR